MIRSMNKYAFLVFHSDYEGFLHKLRSLGVLHVNEQKDSREVEELRGILSERTPYQGYLARPASLYNRRSYRAFSAHQK